MPNDKKPILVAIDAMMQAIAAKKAVCDEYDLEYSELLKILPSDVAESFSAMGSKEAEEVGLPSLKYCLCESPEGDYPAVYAYNNLPDLVKAIHSRIGKETAVSVFYGLPLVLTKLPKADGSADYYLRLPNQTAVKLTKAGELDVSAVADLDEGTKMEILEHGWMGADAYMQSQYFRDGTTDPFQEVEQKKFEGDDEDNLTA